MARFLRRAPHNACTPKATGSDGVNRSRVPTGFLLRKPAALLRLLAEGQTPLALPEHLTSRRPTASLPTLSASLKRPDGVAKPDAASGRNVARQHRALLRLLTEHTPGESVPVPCLMCMPPGDPRTGRQQKPSGRADKQRRRRCD